MSMSRFFKSAAFPILIVVVLAFFAQKLIGNSSHQPKETFGDLLTQLDSGQVKSWIACVSKAEKPVRVAGSPIYAESVTAGSAAPPLSPTPPVSGCGVLVTAGALAAGPEALARSVEVR